MRHLKRKMNTCRIRINETFVIVPSFCKRHQGFTLPIKRNSTYNLVPNLKVVMLFLNFTAYIYLLFFKIKIQITTNGKFNFLQGHLSKGYTVHFIHQGIKLGGFCFSLNNAFLDTFKQDRW